MADESKSVPLLRQGRVQIGAAAIVMVIVGLAVWIWLTAGRESTDDAQVDGHVTQVASRVGGTVLHVLVDDNQRVEAGVVLVELDPRDYRVAVDRARAELADAVATATAAKTGVPVTSTEAKSNVSSARGSVEQARSGVEGSQREIDAARARLVTAQARQREADANAAKATRDVERLRGLLAQDEVSQQQFDSATAAAEAQKAAADSARSQVVEADAAVRVAESKLTQALAGEQQARAGLLTAQTGPQQVAGVKARAEAAAARVDQAKSALAQAELNLQYATLKAPTGGIVSRKTVETGQIVQPGQPLMALIPLDRVWITANFKETQLTNVKPGQKAAITVDAYGGKQFQGHVDSIAAATGARFSMLPPENATGNYVKVVQRVPVKIVLEPGQDPDHLLRPGLSVVPTVYTGR